MNSIHPALAAACSPASVADSFRPSEYTGLLLQAVQARVPALSAGSALEIGVGSGVVLAALGLLGVQRLRGIDIDPDAVAMTNRLLRSLSLADRARVSRGHLWDGVDAERFDIVVANLPQFPTQDVSDCDRSPFWGAGGADGRALMDPFLDRLAAHLNPAGLALITHSTIVGISQTSAAMARHGLLVQPLLATQVRLAAEKAALLGTGLWERFDRRGLLRIGGFTFIEAQVLEIRWA